MSRKYRKVLAALLAAVTVLGNFIAADAAKGSGQGTGSLDIVKYPNVFDVVLPTNAGSQFDYILDPTGILAQAGSDKYGSASFERGKTMYFRNKPASGSDVANYKDVSEAITAYNKGNIDVEIKIQAKLETTNGITISTSRTAGDTSTDPKMYLALTEGSANTEKAVTTQGTVATASIPSAKVHYRTVYDVAGDLYKNVLKPEAANAPVEEYGTYFASYSFMLTGDCNPGGNWEDLKTTPPSVKLVWSIDKMEGAAIGESGLPELPDNPDKPDDPDKPITPGGPSVTFSEDGLISITGLTSKINYGNMVTLTYDGQTSQNLDSDRDISWGASDWTSADGGILEIQLKEKWLRDLKGKSVTVTVKLTDGTSITAVQQL